MIEVFKTNVKNHLQASTLLGCIHNTFCDYHANFDLADCDNILRIKTHCNTVNAKHIIELLRDFGFHAEVLSDEINLSGIDRAPGIAKIEKEVR